jgi:hypothetical protein
VHRIPEDKASQVPVSNIVPKSRDCTLQCNVIGLRELVPYDLLPINKPFITIDAGLGAKVNTKNSSHPNAQNPNFLEVKFWSTKVKAKLLFLKTVLAFLFSWSTKVKPNFFSKIFNFFETNIF